MADCYARYLYAARSGNVNFHNGGLHPFLHGTSSTPHQGAHMKPGIAIPPVVMLLDLSRVDVLL
jgi:hypothetical protein